MGRLPTYGKSSHMGSLPMYGKSSHGLRYSTRPVPTRFEILYTPCAYTF
jgi:hypothetical protein